MSRATLDAMAQVLRSRYIAHEISAAQYAAAMEDIKLCERRAR